MSIKSLFVRFRDFNSLFKPLNFYSTLQMIMIQGVIVVFDITEFIRLSRGSANYTFIEESLVLSLLLLFSLYYEIKNSDAIIKDLEQGENIVMLNCRSIANLGVINSTVEKIKTESTVSKSSNKSNDQVMQRDQSKPCGDNLLKNVRVIPANDLPPAHLAGNPLKTQAPENEWSARDNVAQPADLPEAPSNPQDLELRKLDDKFMLKLTSVVKKNRAKKAFKNRMKKLKIVVAQPTNNLQVDSEENKGNRGNREESTNIEGNTSVALKDGPVDVRENEISEHSSSIPDNAANPKGINEENDSARS
eukprot:TRINITY_DN15880_c0_g2_i1.p1 TRINITY_DN15880_c0_g2~~TRINITY_DN15880_c0_g2_i1.p1  ORF type:complete len:305 (-),score=33.04 TRINITY_DN15880_c0_g2_i1:100-1014(-)